MHELTLPYSPNSNGIVEPINQIIYWIAPSMTIAILNFPSLWAKAIIMAA
jgi:hypothetical protein